jgi:hypothetical protein
MKATDYFRRVVQPKRPYVTDAAVSAILAAPLRREQQEDGRWRFWGAMPDGRFMRVVTEADGETVHNAFFDRRFRP